MAFASSNSKSLRKDGEMMYIRALLLSFHQWPAAVCAGVKAYRSRQRSVAMGAGIVLAAGWLAAAPAQAQEAIKSLGPLPDAATALGPRALADLNRMITQGDALFDVNQGVACKVDLARLQQEADKSGRAAGGVTTAIKESARVMISGACPDKDGVFSGPVEYIDITVSRSDAGNIVMDSHRALRETGVYVQGRVVGQSTTLVRSKNTTYHKLSSGELVAPQGAGSQDIGHYLTYATDDQSGKTIRPRVMFYWSEAQKSLLVSVKESPDGQRQVETMYANGKPTMRMRTKNGSYHGWMEYFDPALVQLKQDKVCYQNGTQVKAWQCPDT